MAIQSQPSRIPEPFAGSGTRNTIPATNATPSASQAASWASGFPPECSQPISAGGCPVPRNDVNGALNQLSQDFAFRQDGGIWEWSALADYDTQRMVLGSDGKLYWSMAQSGPNIAAGAQDPTTDDGTYWGAIPANAPSVLDRSSKLVSSQWVKDAFGTASLYVDPATGDDSNDGLTAGTAVKTIAQALSLLEMRTGHQGKIYLASGSYTEDISLVGVNVQFELLGNVSIAGQISAMLGTIALFFGNYMLTVASTGSGAVYVGAQSYISFTTSQIDLSATNTGHIVSTGQNCAMFFGGDLTVSGSNISSDAIMISNGSSCAFDKAVNLVSSGCYSGLYLSARSFCYINGYFVESGSFGGGHGFSAVDNSAVKIGTGTSTFYDGFVVTTGSAVRSSANITLISNGDNTCLDLSNGGIYFQDTGDLSIRNTTSSAFTLLSCDGAATFAMSSSGTLSFNAPAVTHTVYCSRQSLIYINANPKVTGTVRSGSRYRATVGGTISINGRGPNLFPGSTAGTALAADYALYV